MCRLLDARQREFSHRPGVETAVFVLSLVAGMSRDAVTTGSRLVDVPEDFDAERFSDELLRAVCGYLGIR